MASSSPQKTRGLGEDGLGAQQLSETTTGAVVTAPSHIEAVSHKAGATWMQTLMLGVVGRYALPLLT